jgi:hypothetical protein
MNEENTVEYTRVLDPSATASTFSVPVLIIRSLCVSFFPGGCDLHGDTCL